MRITLVLTHGCNLACSYCYAGEKFNRAMSYETGCQALRMAFAQSRPGEVVTVGFFGGEPMMEFRLMVRLCRVANRVGLAAAATIRFMVTTNATILSERQLRFLSTYNFEVSLSVDGLGDGNRHRPFATGRDSNDVVWPNIARAARWLERLRLLTVLGPDTLHDVGRTVQVLDELGVHSISLLPNVDVTWSEAAWEQALTVFRPLAAKAETMRAELHPFVERYRPTAAHQACGLGETEVTVSPLGHLYPCARLVGTDRRRELRIGHVRKGIDTAGVQRLRQQGQERMSACGVDSSCGCVPHMPGIDAARQIEQYGRFGRTVDAAVEAARMVRVA